MAGDDLQSLIFWQEACRLLTEPDRVKCVAYSDRDLGVFDDVVTYYHPHAELVDRTPVRADCYQVKFNMRSSHPISAADFTDPTAVGRTKIALLDDLVTLSRRGHGEDTIYRPILRSTWMPAQGDALDDAWLRTDGRLDLGKLLAASGRTKLGKAARGWVTHLGRWLPEELEPCLRHFRIHTVSDLTSQRSELNTRLQNAGLQELDSAHRVSPYDDLIRKLVQDGMHRFHADDLREMLQAEGLVVGSPVRRRAETTVGIRSFERGSDHMSGLDHCLDLRHLFNGRYPRSQETWATEVLPAIEELVRDLSRTPGAIELDLSAAHSSIAFVAGRLLDTKSGLRTAVIQRTQQGPVRWDPPTAPADETLPSWTIDSAKLGDGTGVAVALSATHDIGAHVRAYIMGAHPDIGVLLSFELPGGPGRAAVRSGQHAHQLAEELTRTVRAERAFDAVRGLHVFAAAPNALVFCLGQHSRGLGSCHLYEHDFDSDALGAYAPSIVFGGRDRR